jgi:uncharacterized membrane protein YjgN (DUF898 family)
MAGACSDTPGWYTPAMDMRLARHMWNETQWGTQRFRIRLDDSGLAGGALYGAFAPVWVCIVGGYVALIATLAMGEYVTLDDLTYAPREWVISLAALALFVVLGFLAWVNYQRVLMIRKAELVRLDAATFSIDATFLSLLWLHLGNALILVLTLGFGEPVASARTFKYVFNRLKAKGTVDVDVVLQGRGANPKSGEGLADTFDIGGF